MISPELLRRYSFFGSLNEDQLKAIAMIAEMDKAEAEGVLFEEGQPAQYLYLLLEGAVDLYYKSEEKFHPTVKKEFHVGVINPGELFSLSALIEPHLLNATGRAAQASRFVRFDGAALRELMDRDCELGYFVLQQLTKALMERLTYTRIQLAAAWA
jgi:CRP-like cAMP-binding protein